MACGRSSPRAKSEGPLPDKARSIPIADAVFRASAIAGERAQHGARIARAASKSRRDGNALAHAHMRERGSRARIGERAYPSRRKVVAGGGTNVRRGAHIELAPRSDADTIAQIDRG